MGRNLFVTASDAILNPVDQLSLTFNIVITAIITVIWL